MVYKIFLLRNLRVWHGPEFFELVVWRSYGWGVCEGAFLKAKKQMYMDIQKLIDWAKDCKEKAFTEIGRHNYYSEHSEAFFNSKEKLKAFSLILQGAELLLKHEPKASAETAPCANAVLGESAANEGSSTLTPPAGGFGGTPAVRQNEQTMEVLTGFNILVIKNNCVEKGKPVLMVNEADMPVLTGWLRPPQG